MMFENMKFQLGDFVRHTLVDVNPNKGLIVERMLVEDSAGIANMYTVRVITPKGATRDNYQREEEIVPWK